MLDSKHLYLMRMEIYADALGAQSEKLRGYTDDWIADPLPLNTVEYIEVGLPATCDTESLNRWHNLSHPIKIPHQKTGAPKALLFFDVFADNTFTGSVHPHPWAG